MNKKKVLMISDHPLSPSGVGHMTRLVAESLLKSGRYKLFCLGGAVKHSDYRPMKVEPYGEDWIIIPVDGYGTKDTIRSLLRTERPDAMFIFTDPRFWIWLWEMENEIRSVVPLVYYHTWDNLPFPTFNRPFYESNDKVVTISKLTQEILENVAPTVESEYLPHAVNTEEFKKLSDAEVASFRKDTFDKLGEKNKDKFIFFFNSRNARRKSTGSLIYWFNDFLNIVGRDKACLLMHTDPKDPNGPDLQAVIENFDLNNGEVYFSREKVPSQILTKMYNMVDCTVDIADAEGFGLSTLESIACETPILVTMTGGLQEQVTDGTNWFGIGLQPVSKAVIGSQDVPWIFEDRLSGKDVVHAMFKMYNMSKEERNKLGKMGREHVLKNYNYDRYCSRWVEIFDEVVEKHGSWNTRRNYKSWGLKEIK